ncbi:dipeptidyl aminopeptidase/acylaminoacyl peptidase [Talaromyces proteolyticus]|uniref:Dipeptidyl aminopeptidase/acylaminoacyl peptidase n=1 Tax=Talaromyces proteolyticus TaxID=1131652 RepID=A0AAD4Q4M0_9EURO|nr:dipeptidyl aminopeptidase/acylaminoacyl peptidase [Talaromyces proteolyticus]KAH8703401.1 dipeptidyl aminopeptidase/acylaminoacyl peptidase [Talaromyces proteolyticus]
MAHLLKHLFPNNESFSFEALRAAGYSNTRGADVSEVITICSRIPSGDEDKWLHEWRAAGDRAATNARTSLAKGNMFDARDAFLRASNYYRTAEFYRREDPFNDELSKALEELSRSMFHEATNLMPFPTINVGIPYEGTNLPGIIMRPDNSDEPRPTIILNGGYDSTKEEVIYSLGASALERGFNVLAFDGPGQGQALRDQRLFFRHDWENVVTPVVDYTISQPFVDNNKLIIIGISMGGYLVARASAFEHRAAAIVLNDGIYDFGSAFRNKTPALGKYLMNNGWDNMMNWLMHRRKQWDTGFNWGVSNGKWVFGLTSDVDVIREVNKYTLEGIVENIKTPTLVLDAPDDHFLQGQPKELYDRLKCKKDIGEFTREEGASAHCSIGAGSRLNQVVWDWLTELLF